MQLSSPVATVDLLHFKVGDTVILNCKHSLFSVVWGLQFNTDVLYSGIKHITNFEGIWLLIL